MPPAARITDLHTCPMVTPGTPPVPHVGGPIIKGSPTVFTGKLLQARVTDQCTCVGPPDVIVKGSLSVFVNSLPAARMADQTAHGGVIVKGEPTVIIGDAMGGGGGGGGGAGKTGGKAGQGLTTDIAPGWIDTLGKHSETRQQVASLVAAAEQGAPFCEACMKLAGG